MTAHGNEIEELLNDALDGRLDADALAAFQERLARDPELAREWEHRRVLRETLLGLGSEPAPRDFADRIGFLLRERPEQDPAPSPERHEAPNPSITEWLSAPWRSAGAWRSVAALLLVGVVGYTLWNHRQDSAGRPEAATANETSQSRTVSEASEPRSLSPRKTGEWEKGADFAKDRAKEFDAVEREAKSPAEKGPTLSPVGKASPAHKVLTRLYTIDPAGRKLGTNLNLHLQQQAYRDTIEQFGTTVLWDAASKAPVQDGAAVDSVTPGAFEFRVPPDLVANIAANSLTLPESTFARIQEIAVPPVITGTTAGLAANDEAADVKLSSEARRKMAKMREMLKEAEEKKLDRVEARQRAASRKKARPERQNKSAKGRRSKGDRPGAAVDLEKAEKQPAEGQLLRLEAAELTVAPVAPLATTDYLLTGPAASRRVSGILASLRQGKASPRLAARLDLLSRSQVATTKMAVGGGAAVANPSGGKKTLPVVEWQLFGGSLTEGEIRTLVSRLESEPDLRIRTLSPPAGSAVVSPAPPAAFVTPWDPDLKAPPAPRRQIRLLAVSD